MIVVVACGEEETLLVWLLCFAYYGTSGSRWLADRLTCWLASLHVCPVTHFRQTQVFWAFSPYYILASQVFGRRFAGWLKRLKNQKETVTQHNVISILGQYCIEVVSLELIWTIKLRQIVNLIFYRCRNCSDTSATWFLLVKYVIITQRKIFLLFLTAQPSYAKNVYDSPSVSAAVMLDKPNSMRWSWCFF